MNNSESQKKRKLVLLRSPDYVSDDDFEPGLVTNTFLWHYLILPPCLVKTIDFALRAKHFELSLQGSHTFTAFQKSMRPIVCLFTAFLKSMWPAALSLFFKSQYANSLVDFSKVDKTTFLYTFCALCNKGIAFSKCSDSPIKRASWACLDGLSYTSDSMDLTHTLDLALKAPRASGAPTIRY